MLLIDAAHQSSCWRQHFVHENEDCLFRRKLDPLADYIDELSNCKVRGDEVLLLIDRGDIRLLRLFANDGNTIRVLLTDTLGLGLFKERQSVSTFERTRMVQKEDGDGI